MVSVLINARTISRHNDNTRCLWINCVVQLVHILRIKIDKLLTWSRLMEGFFSLEGWVREIAARKRCEGRIRADQTIALCMN